MNGADLHLAINHIPVVAMPICFLALVIGALRKSHDLTQAAFAGIVLTALITLPVWKTGGPAARVVRSYPGITREQIHEHAEAAEKGAIAMGVLGVIALFGWWQSRRPEGASKAILILSILGTLLISVAMSRIAHLGGEIRHPELDAGAAAAQAAGSSVQQPAQ